MEQQQQVETGKKGSVANYLRMGLIIVGIAFIVLTVIMAIYRKFGG